MIQVHNCPATLAKGFKTYSPKAIRELFAGRKVSHVLSFPSPVSHKKEADVLLKNKRISISGVQAKYSLQLMKNQMVPTQTKGDYILKPIPQRIPNASQAPANEHLTMQLARQIFGIQTAACAMIFFDDDAPAYLTRRFDYKPDGSKYKQEDFAIIANRTSQTHGENFKYNFSYETIANLMRQCIGAYKIEIEKYFRLVLFNYLFSNGDAHLRNFSVIESSLGDFILSPAYDLLNTHLHGDNTDMAAHDGFFSDDFETEGYQVNAFYAYDDFLEFGKRIGMTEIRVRKIIADISDAAKEAKVKDLINRSFLDKENKENYYQMYQEQLKRFRYSFLKQITEK